MEMSLEDYFKDFIEKRVEEIEVFNSCNDKGYMDLQYKASKLKQAVLLSLPEIKKDILLEYESVESTCQIFIHEKIYKQGLLDGIKIFNTVTDFKKNFKNL